MSVRMSIVRVTAIGVTISHVTEAQPFNEDDLADNPFAQFAAWFEEAGKVVDAPEVMTIATATADGRPSARMLLLKDHGPDGFVFFSSYESRKGRELAENPNAALTLYWAELERQVSVAGTVAKTSRAESEKYFAQRPRGSRLGACVSRQSAVVPNETFLEERLAELEREFAGRSVPTPAHWGGYRLTPTRIEFWQGRPNRLHDRFLYSRQADGSWRIERLSP